VARPRKFDPDDVLDRSMREFCLRRSELRPIGLHDAFGGRRPPPFAVVGVAIDAIVQRERAMPARRRLIERSRLHP